MGFGSTLLSGAAVHTSLSVRHAMLAELDPSSPAFSELQARLREKLLDLAGASAPDSMLLCMAGTAATALRAALAWLLPENATLLAPVNGPAGRARAALARRMGYEVLEAPLPESAAIDPAGLGQRPECSAPISALLAVHAEPETGIFNPLAPLGALAAARGWRFIVDASLTCGAYPIDMGAFAIDALATASGFSLESAAGLGILALSGRRIPAFPPPLPDDSESPPIPLLLALEQALIELEQEGGVAGRAARYRDNHQTLIRGMAALGFEPLAGNGSRSYLTARFRPPAGCRPERDLTESLRQRGFLISPGPLVATMGRIYPATIESFLSALRDVLAASHAAA